MNDPQATRTHPNRLAALFAPPTVRWDRVREARRRIANGDYEHSEVWSVVIDRLCSDVDPKSKRP